MPGKRLVFILGLVIGCMLAGSYWDTDWLARLDFYLLVISGFLIGYCTVCLISFEQIGLDKLGQKTRARAQQSRNTEVDH